MSVEEKLAFADGIELEQPKRHWGKLMYKFTAEIQVKALSEGEAKNMVGKLARGSYLLVDNLKRI